MNLVNSKAATRFCREHQIILVGGKDELRNSHGHGDLELGLEAADVGIAIFGSFESFSNRFGRGDDQLIRTSGSNETSLRGNAEQRGRSGR